MYANVYGSRTIQKHDADFKSEPSQMRHPLHLATILYVQVRGLDFKAVPSFYQGFITRFADLMQLQYAPACCSCHYMYTHTYLHVHGDFQKFRVHCCGP